MLKKIALVAASTLLLAAGVIAPYGVSFSNLQSKAATVTPTPSVSPSASPNISPTPVASPTVSPGATPVETPTPQGDDPRGSNRAKPVPTPSIRP
ncbi:MAG TPA: hypothetical protein VGO43_15515 [Pyrinomonadaceae bacterium]|jgi:hypothetical protein|nr:hypothetical protein [Pyrinomonadaceae bacterium]